MSGPGESSSSGAGAEPARPAKKAKSEANALTAVEELLLECCKAHPQWIAPQDQLTMAPPKEYALHTLETNPSLQGADKELMGQAVQRLLKSSRLTLANHPKGGRCLKYVSLEAAQQQVERFGGLTTNELLVFQKIEEARNRGLFQKDLKAKTGITNPNTIKTIIDKLVKRRLIKDFTSVHTGKKKMYILAELEPSAELTGGNWYTNGELDCDLVETCYKLALCLFRNKKREGASVKEVQTFIRSKNIIKCELSCEEVLQLVGTLMYDGKLAPMNQSPELPAAERTFRVLSNESAHSHEHYSSVPLAVCPIAQSSNPPQPRDCPHLDYWLSL